MITLEKLKEKKNQYENELVFVKAKIQVVEELINEYEVEEVAVENQENVEVEETENETQIGLLNGYNA